jgi:hypothetical protein
MHYQFGKMTPMFPRLLNYDSSQEQVPITRIGLITSLWDILKTASIIRENI